MKRIFCLLILQFVMASQSLAAPESEIEKQLEEIGRIQNDEVIVVQRKYTRKSMRHEFTPLMFGGIPFGTVRRTLFGGAGYALHINDWFAWDAFNFNYTKTFFSSFTDDINNNKDATRPNGSAVNQPKIVPDIQKIQYFITTGVQLTPFYGKVSSLSRWIAYVEPYFSLFGGLAKTESSSYFTFGPGVGIRIFFREWLSMRLDFKDYMYTETATDRTNGGTRSTFTNNYSVMLSLSFWLPKMPR